MQVEQPSEPSIPFQSTYRRKVAVLERQKGTEEGIANASSSSPLHQSISSPSKFEQDDMMRDTDQSCNTTVSSDDEELEDEGVVTKRKSVKKAINLNSDDDGEDEEEEDDDDDEVSKRDQDPSRANAEEDDAAFLKRFRESRAAKMAEEQRRSHSDIFSSSTLSDPPTLSASSHPTEIASPSATTSGISGLRRDNILSGADHLSLTPDSSPNPMLARLPQSLESSSETQKSITSSPYITEAQKQEEKRTRKLSRESKVKELAKKRGKNQMEQVDESAQVDEEDDDDDEIDEVESSTSESQKERDGEDLPSAIKAAQLASHKRRKADDRKRAEEFAKKTSRKSKGGGKAGVLQMRADEDSDSDLDFSSNRVINDNRQVIKALSKKEEEMMHKTQARIERELKANQAKTLRIRGERPIFGLSDLLSSFDQQEGFKKDNQKSAQQIIEDANNSDPIESGSEEDDTLRHNRKQLLMNHKSSSRLSEQFTPLLKELSPILTEEKALQEDNGEDLPDAADASRLILEERNRRDKLAALKEKKAQAFKAMQLSRANQQEDEEEDDDLILIGGKSNANRPIAMMTKPKLEKSRLQPRVSRYSSPGQISDEASEDDLITTSQVQRAGKALRAPSIEKQEATMKQPNEKNRRKGQETKEAVPTPEELNESILRKARLQNIEMRRKKEEAFGRKKEAQKKADSETVKEEDTSDIIRRLREAHEKSGFQIGSDAVDSDGSEYNPEDVAKEGVMIDLGSGEEDEEEGEEEGRRILSGSDSGEETNDSEKENSVPASQESFQPRMPRRSRILIDDDEQEGDEGAVQIIGLSQERSPLQPIIVEHEEDGEEEEVAAAEREQKHDDFNIALLDSSSEAGFSQFFQQTQMPVQAQASSSSPRHISSTLGKFFEDTQTDQPLRGESFPVLMDQGDDSGSLGFSQFFNEGTQVPKQKNNRLMPPPTTSARGLTLLDGTDQDPFAALRRLQESEARNLHFDADVLPSLEEVGGVQEDHLAALEMEALQAEIEERQEKEKKRREEANVTYINKDGFFTQTKPDYERYSQSQSQSQSERGKWEDRQMNNFSMESIMVEQEPQARKRKRFRRAVSMEKAEEQEERQVSTTSIYLETTVDGEKEKVEPEEEEISIKPRDAFEVLKEAVSRSTRDVSIAPVARAEKNRFVQGEAEESDDEGEGPVGKKRKKGRGGLGGVFSDEEAESEEEENEDDQDDKDLEELIDEEKDEREAEKDILARERYFKDREADDQAALALHEKAIRGGLRNKRRAVGLDGTLEGFLDDDYEEEWLERRVKNPYGTVARKRRLEGKDGLDLLEANEESQAFVREYRATHDKETDLDKYSFLLPADGEDDDEQQQQQDHRMADSDSNEDEEREDDTSRLTHQQFKKELEDRRRRQKQAQRLSDDEDESQREVEEQADTDKRLAEEEEDRMMKRIQREAYGHSSDEDDDDFASTKSIIRNRLRRVPRPDPFTRRNAADDDDDDTFAYSTLLGIANSRILTEHEQERLAQLQSEYANEPEWGNQDKNRKVSSNRNSSGTGGSITSFGSRQTMRKSASEKSISSSTSHQKQPHRVRSKLGHFMNRQGHFTESQDD